MGCHGISCASASLCAAVDGAGDVLTSTNPTGGAAAWKATSVNPGGGLAGVSCVSASLCIAVGSTAAHGGGEGVIFTSTSPTGGSAAWKIARIGGTLYLDGASCGSLSLCVAYGRGGSPPNFSGYVVTSTNPTGGDSAWTATSVDSDSLTGMSCPSASLCIGVEGNHVLSSMDPSGGAGAWSTVDVAGPPGGQPPSFLDVSCPSVSLCVAVDFLGDVSTSSDPTGSAGAWSTVHVDGGNALVAVSCASASFCAAVDQYRYVVGSTDPTVGAASWVNASTGDYGMAALSCPSASLCVAVDGQAQIATSTDPLAGSAWHVAGGVFPSGGTSQFTVGSGVSCPSASFCAAVAYTESCGGMPYFCYQNPPGYVAVTDDPSGGAGAWTSTILPSVAPTSISCPTVSLCVLGDYSGDVVASANPTAGSGAWSTARIDDQGSPLVGVSCPAATLCVAVDTGGNAFVSTNPTGGLDAWKRTHLTPTGPDGYPYPLTGVSCGGRSLCVAVDANGNAYTSTYLTGGAGAWTAAHIDSSNVSTYLNGISCPSTHLCVAVDDAGNSILGTPAPPPPPPPPPTRAQIKALLLRDLARSGNTATITALLKHGGCQFSAKALGAGTLRIFWYYLPSNGRPRPGKNRRPILIASGTASFPTAGLTRLMIRLTPAGRHVLKRTKRLKVYARGSFTPTGKPAVSATRVFTLTRNRARLP